MLKVIFRSRSYKVWPQFRVDGLWIREVKNAVFLGEFHGLLRNHATDKKRDRNMGHQRSMHIWRDGYLNERTCGGREHFFLLRNTFWFKVGFISYCLEPTLHISSIYTWTCLFPQSLYISLTWEEQALNSTKCSFAKWPTSQQNGPTSLQLQHFLQWTNIIFFLCYVLLNTITRTLTIKYSSRKDLLATH